MSDYPRPNRSPYFKTFTARRTGNVVQNRQNLLQQASRRVTAEQENLQHYALMRDAPSRRALGGFWDTSQPAGAVPHNPYQQSPMQQNPVTQSPVLQTPMQHSPVQHSPMQQSPVQQTIEQPPNRAQPGPQTDKAPQLSPQTAAERFQQVNRGLPDGVVFEPLDNETRAVLQSIGITGQAKPNIPPSVAKPNPAPVATVVSSPAAANTTVPVPGHKDEKPDGNNTASPESANMLEGLIQDEYNAAVYYKYLSGAAPSGDFQKKLQGIANDCEKRRGLYQSILKNLHGRGFEPKNNPVNTTVGFAQGMEMAVMEENKMLDAMTELMEHLTDRASIYTMQSLLNKRMIRLNWLQWALFKLK